MTEPNGGTIRTIAWSEIFPWLGLVRVFRMSIRFRALFFGAAGILLTAIGWSWIAAIFVAPAVDSPATKWLDRYRPCPWEAVVGLVPDKPGLPVAFAPRPGVGCPCGNMNCPCGKGQLPTLPDKLGSCAVLGSTSAKQSPHEPVFGPWLLLMQPALRGLNCPGAALSLRDIACLILCGLWGAGVWAFFGGAIARSAAVQLAADEQIGAGAALRFAVRKWPAYVAAPLLPIGGAMLAAVPVVILGWIMCTAPACCWAVSSCGRWR